MTQTTPPRRRFWIRRTLNLLLLSTAVAIWMDLHHIRPWAYLPESAPAPVPSNFEQRISGVVEAPSLMDLIADLERDYRIRVEYQDGLENQLKGQEGAIKMLADEAPLHSVLATAILSYGTVRLERRGNVLEVSSVASPLTAETRVHPTMGSWAAAKTAQSPVLQASATPGMVPQRFIRGNSRTARIAWSRAQYIWRYNWSQIPYGGNTDFPFDDPSALQMIGGVTVYGAHPARHEAFRQLDLESAGKVHGPKDPIRVGRSTMEPFEAALREKVSLQVDSIPVEKVIKRLLGGQLPYILSRYNESHQWKRLVTLQVKDISRLAALELALRQCKLHATVGNGVVSIERNHRDSGRRETRVAFVGDLFNQPVAMPYAFGSTLRLSTMGSNIHFGGSWQHIEHAEAQLRAGREALQLTKSGEIVFVGDESTRRIEHALLEPAKPLGRPETAGELAKALRQAYDINVVVLPAHKDKKLIPLATDQEESNENSTPLFRVLRAMLPKGEAGRITVEHGALLLEFGGTDDQQRPEYWIRTNGVHDERYGTMMLVLLGNSPEAAANLANWPSAFHHSPLSQVSFARTSRNGLMDLRRMIRIVDETPNDELVRFNNRLFARKYALPAGIKPLPEISIEEHLTPRTRTRSPEFTMVETRDGLVVVGAETEHAAFAELMDRLPSAANGEREDRLARLSDDDWVVRHAAAMEILSELRVQPDAEKLKAYGETFLLGDKLATFYRKLFLKLIADIKLNDPELTGLYVKPFKDSRDTDFRFQIIDLLFEAGLPAQGVLHELATEMTDDELTHVESKLVQLPGVLEQRDWLPLILQLLRKKRGSQPQLRQLLRNAQGDFSSPGFPVIPNLSKVRGEK